MGRRLQAEEFIPDEGYLGQMRSIADLAREESSLRMDRSTQAQDKVTSLQLRGADSMADGIKGGVDNFYDRKDKADKIKREEAQLERSNSREDAADKRQQEEFDAGAGERGARKELGATAYKQNMDAQEAAIAGNRAQARQATVGADSMEREEAIMNGVAQYGDAKPGETNRMYLSRLDREGKTAQLRLAQSQLDEQIAGRPGRERLQTAQIGQANAGIAASQASTEAQRTQTASLKKEARMQELAARMGGGDPKAIARDFPQVQAALQSGEITSSEALQLVGQIKSGAVQREMQGLLLENTRNQNPMKAQEIEQTVKARNDAQAMTAGIAAMQSAADTNSAAAFFTDEGSKDEVVQMLRTLNMTKDADELEDPSFMEMLKDPRGAVSSEAKIASLINKVKLRARAQLAVMPEATRKDPKVMELSAMLNNLGGAAPKASLFGQPAQAPMNAQGAPMGAPQPLPGRNARKRVAPAQVGGPK